MVLAGLTDPDANVSSCALQTVKWFVQYTEDPDNEERVSNLQSTSAHMGEEGEAESGIRKAQKGERKKEGR